MFEKIQSLSVENMDKFEGGSLVTRMTNDITQMQNFTNGMMRIFFKAPIMCVGAIVMAATLNFRTVPIIAPVIIVVGFIIATGLKLTFPRFKKVQLALDKLNTTMREYLAGIRLVKAFRRFDEEEKRFSSANDDLADNTVKAIKLLVLFTPLVSLCVNFGVAAVIFFGAGWIDTGDMQVGQIMAFITYMTQIMNSLGMIAMVLGMFVRVKTSNERIREVFEAEDDHPVNAKALPPLRGGELNKTSEVSENSPPWRGADEVGGVVPHITFSNVAFSYAGSTGQAALSGLDFALCKGETLGVIGPTGAGKSTLAALLMRFYEASDGEIRISDTPINNIPENILRDQIAIVPQTASLFTGTIRENILWGKEDASDIEIENAAKIAEAHEFIASKSAMPDGYDTMIGQHGVNLSGGQKQHVSIARAIISEPEILVLVDCTSALDVMTEAKVKRAIRNLENNMTCVLITQRVNTVMTCDKILVLDNGEQAGFGAHGELMRDCAVYRDIYMSQIGREEENANESAEPS